MPLAIFDLDNTLLAGDSDYLWGQFLGEIGAVDRDAYDAEVAATPDGTWLVLTSSRSGDAELYVARSDGSDQAGRYADEATDVPAAARRPGGGPRRRARSRALQALYQWQLTGQSGQDIFLQFSADDDHAQVDQALGGHGRLGYAPRTRLQACFRLTACHAPLRYARKRSCRPRT